METARIGILVVAYNAAATLARVLDRIPASVRARVADVLVFDDHSQDTTYLVGLGYKSLATDLPMTVVRHEQNLGYGGNQKAGYRWAIDHGLDIVVLLHGDGQYAPECLEDLIGPLERDECDVVLGSRMLEPGMALRGGMPRYKYVGNRILTSVENALVGTSLSEWHSGYRAYRTAALAGVPFEANSDGFDFDTEILIQLIESGRRVSEVPIPTYYGDEICYVNGLRYAADVTRDALRYRAHKMGLGTGETAFASDAYEWKDGPETSHGVLERRLAELPAGAVLDLGCSTGELSRRIRKLGHAVTGVDAEEPSDAAEHFDRFVVADLERPLPDSLTGPFDVVVAADVLEHVARPGRLLEDLAGRLGPEGRVLASVPNFAHWYPRLRVLAGRFDYDRRGILDAGHLRFFTRRSFERLARRHGYEVRRVRSVGVPFEVAGRGGRPGQGRLAGWLGAVDHALVRLWPGLFAYQYLFELVPDRRGRRPGAQAGHPGPPHR